MLVCSKHPDGGGSDMAGWAPIFVPVQAIASTLHSQLDTSDEAKFQHTAKETLSTDWLIEHVVGVPEPSVVAMLKEAVATSRAVFVFDGVDEAGVVREVVEDFI